MADKRLIYKGLRSGLPGNRLEGSFYLCTDTRELYYGQELYTETVRFYQGEEKPSAPAQGVMYISEQNGSIDVWDGVKWKNVVKTNSASSGTDVIISETEPTDQAENGEWLEIISIQSVMTKIDIIPSQSGSLAYNGTAQSPLWNNFNNNTMTLSGDTSEVNAGTYYAVFTPKNGYCWADDSTGEKRIEWEIEKADCEFSIDKTSIVLDVDNKTSSISVTRDGDGEVAAVSNDGSCVSVSVSDASGDTPIVTVTGVKNGNATITISAAEGTNYLEPESKTCNVSSSIAKSLSDSTWQEISEISKNNQGANNWSVGDMKPIHVSGTIGTLSVDETLNVFILGFNHNSEVEGNGIQFGMFKNSDGKDVFLSDANPGKSNPTGSSGVKYFNMNHWGTSTSPRNTNYGGWKGCDLRYDILGSTNTAPSGYGSTPTTSRVGYDAADSTPTNPVANTLMAALPLDLRAVMKPIKKYTDNKGNSVDVASNVTQSIDYLPLMSEVEVVGTMDDDYRVSNKYEANYQMQYDYYVLGNEMYKYHYGSPNESRYYYLRSPRGITSSGDAIKEHFCCIPQTGYGTTAASYASYTSLGLSPVFMV